MCYNSDESVEQKIRYFFERHIGILQKNPNLPVFMINEINQNPERIVKIATDANIQNVYKKFLKQIDSGASVLFSQHLDSFPDGSGPSLVALGAFISFQDSSRSE